MAAINVHQDRHISHDWQHLHGCDVTAVKHRRQSCVFFPESYFPRSKKTINLISKEIKESNDTYLYFQKYFLLSLMIFIAHHK
jgi:hypothetical protein